MPTSRPQAALIYNVLGSVTRVVRRHFIVQVYGLAGAQDRDALDAADLAAGPVCELPLPTHIPWGLHGTWVEPGSGAVL